VLEEVKWRALEFSETRKFKIAQKYNISKKIKRNEQKKKQFKEEKLYFHKLLSLEMSQMIVQRFSNPIGS
jgi:hypothetical protein